MRETNPTIFEIERQISIIAVRVRQQRRIVEGLPDGVERLEARSVYADLLRNEHELERHRPNQEAAFCLQVDRSRRFE